MPVKPDEAKETFSLYDDVGDGKIDCLAIGTVARALGLKPTNAMVHKAAGQEFKRSGEKRISFEEWYPMYEQLCKEKEVGSFADFLEGFKVFDQEATGKIMAAEIRHVLQALGERLALDDVDEIMLGVEDADGMVNYKDFINKVLAGPFPDQEA